MQGLFFTASVGCDTEWFVPDNASCRDGLGVTEKGNAQLRAPRPETIKMPLDTIDPSKRIFLSVEEVAQLFGLSKKTVYRLLDRGLLRSSNAVRHKMILRASVDEFVAKTVNNG